MMESFILGFSNHFINKSFFANLIGHFFCQVSIISWPPIVNQGSIVIERPPFLVGSVLLEEICVCDPSQLLCWDSSFP